MGSRNSDDMKQSSPYQLLRASGRLALIGYIGRSDPRASALTSAYQLSTPCGQEQTSQRHAHQSLRRGRICRPEASSIPRESSLQQVTRFQNVANYSCHKGSPHCRPKLANRWGVQGDPVSADPGRQSGISRSATNCAGSGCPYTRQSFATL